MSWAGFRKAVHSSLWVRISLPILLIGAVSTFAQVVDARNNIERDFAHQSDSQIARLSSLVLRETRDHGGNTPVLSHDLRLIAQATPNVLDIHVLVFSTSGSLVDASTDYEDVGRSVPSEWIHGPVVPGQHGQRYVHVNGVPMLEILKPAQLGTEQATVLAYLSVGEASRTLSNASRSIIVTASLRTILELAVLGLLLYLIVIRWFLRPRLSRLAGAVEMVEQGDYTVRIQAAGAGMGFDRLGGEFDRMVEEVARRESELRDVDEMKNSFLDAISHELRTPLTGVLGLTQTLERHLDQLDPAQIRDLIDRIGKDARRLRKLLENLLDLSRLTRGVITPMREPTKLWTLIEGCVRDIDPLGHTITVDVPQLIANVDAAQIERIVENLVVNSIKYTRPGTVTEVTVRPLAEGFLLSVDDDGPGIPDVDKEQIFRPFSHGPNRSSHSPGTGIGLSLVSRFAELHGGRAWIDDRIGGGASFRVYVPAELTDAQGVET